MKARATSRVVKAKPTSRATKAKSTPKRRGYQSGGVVTVKEGLKAVTEHYKSGGYGKVGDPKAIKAHEAAMARVKKDTNTPELSKPVVGKPKPKPTSNARIDKAVSESGG